MLPSLPPTPAPAGADPALTRALAAYIPEILADELAGLAEAGAAALPIARARRLECVTMMVDITGFTPLCEALARTGREGAERVTELINSFFTQALRPVRDMGGVVTKFGGDAFQAFFERGAGEDWAAAGRRALRSAWVLQSVVNDYAPVAVPGAEQRFRLAAKVGLSAGPLVLFNVGDPALHCDVQVAGPAANQAAEAEHEATKGEIILHRELLERCGGLAEATLGERRGDCRLLAGLAAPAPAPAGAAPALAALDAGGRERFIAHAAAFVPRRICDRLRLGYPALPGEHRRVVSMFVHFDGFDWLDDPAAPAAFQAFYLDALRTVERFNGNLNRISSGDKGDVLHILFGAPISHQDDEAQAMRCALALRQITRQHPQIRSQQIGVSVGFVFAGDIGGAQRHEYTVIGDSVNLSARLMQRAQPWTILADLATVQRVHELFDFANIRQESLKGKQDAITVCELAGASAGGRAQPAAAQLVGRDAELALIQAELAAASAGAGRVLAIHGEPGIGKSLLLSQVAERWRLLGGRRCQTAAAHYERGAFRIWSAWLSDLFGLVASDSPADRAAHFRDQFAALLPELIDWAPLWAELMNLDPGDSPLISALDRPTRRQRLADLTPRLLLAWAARQPLLLALDDAHWADQASLELLEQIIPALDQAPVAVCLGYRTAEAPAWKLRGRPGWHELALEPLPAAATELLILRAINADSLNDEQRRRFLAAVNELTGGNPFFIEELINMLRSSPLLEQIMRGGAPADLLSHNIQSLVMGRLDGLDDQLREVVLAAAVVGGQVSAEIIAPLVPPAVAAALQGSEPLSALVELDLLRPEEQAGAQQVPAAAPTYRFRHALLQQVAYESLPFARRRALHEVVGDFLERQAGGAEEDELGRLAFHFERSTNDRKAVHYLARAAGRAARLFANEDAIQQYRTALQRAERDAEAQPRPAELLRELGDVHAQIADFEAALDAYAGSLERVQAGAHFERARLLRRRAEVLVRATRFDAAQAELLETEAALARLEATDRSRAAARRISLARAQVAELYSTMLHRQSLFEEALAQADAGLKRLDGRQGADPLIALTKIKLQQAVAAAAAILGQPGRAEAALQRASRLTRQRRDLLTEGQLALRMAILAMQQDRFRRAIALFERALAMIERTGARDRLAYALLPGGQSLLYSGDFQQAHRWLSRGLALAQEVGTPYLTCSAFTLLGMTDMALGAWDHALAHFDEAIAIARRYELWDRLIEATCRKSEIVAARGGDGPAEAALREALGFAETYRLEGLGAMVRRALAKLGYNRERFAEAADHLRAIAAPSEDNDLIIGECWALATLAGQPAFDPGAVRDQARRALQFYQQHRVGLMLIGALRINGLVAWAAGDEAGALELFGEGLRWARRTGHAPELARLLRARGRLRLGGPPRLRAAARRDLNAAAAIFADLKIAAGEAQG